MYEQLMVEDESSLMDKPLEFFSQVLSLEQLVNYGFHFICELLAIQEGSIYMLSDGHYELKHAIGDQKYVRSCMATKQLKQIATLHGRSLDHGFDQYFDAMFLLGVDIEFIMPITVEDELKGFIIASKTKTGTLNAGQKNYIESIKTLMNMAFHISFGYDRHRLMKQNLDRKIFNLFFNNQSTRALMSELNLEQIFKLCIDVVRELTSSTVTTIGFYDEIRKRMVTKGCVDIATFKSSYVELEVREDFKFSGQLIYSMAEDRALIESIFVNVDDLYDISGLTHLILLIKESLVGYIGVGEPLNGHEYDQEIFEQIESLAGSMYLAVKNAVQVKEMEKQSLRIMEQLKRLEGLNKAIRNINSCKSLDEMTDIVLDTLVYGFGVNKALFVLRLDGVDTIMGERGFEELEIRELRMTESIDEIVYGHGDGLVRRFMDPEQHDRFIGGNVTVFTPIRMDVIDGDGILGYLMVFDLNQPMKEEIIIGINAIANSMAPVVHHFIHMDKLTKDVITDPKVILREKIAKFEEEKVAYELNYGVYYKHIIVEPFIEPDLSQYGDYNPVWYNGVIYCFVYEGEAFDSDAFEGHVVGGTDQMRRFLEVLAG